MRTLALAALLTALPLLAAAQGPAPAEPQAAPAAQPPAPPAPAPPVAQPAPPAPVPGRPAGRDSWYIGFGFGTGSGQFTSDAGTTKFSDAMSSPVTLFGNFKVGGTLSPKLLLGFDLTFLRTDGKGTDPFLGSYSSAIQVSNYDAMLTWFPMERGLLLRGGAGLSNFRVEASVLGASGSDSVNGVNLTFGGGYAFWLGQSFNLTLNLDFSAQSYNSSKAGAPSKASYLALWLGFDWY
jgi:opacity protein-like surface antigen